MKKFICYSSYWLCANDDCDAPIIEEGVKILFDDGSIEFFKSGEQFPLLEEASDNEKRLFGNKKGFLYSGDFVDIAKGRQKGQRKKAVKTFDYYIPYNGEKVTYLVFDDGTKTNIDNCKIEGVTILKFHEKPSFCFLKSGRAWSKTKKTWSFLDIY